MFKYLYPQGLDSKDRAEFYNSKFAYFKTPDYYAVILTALANLAYFYTDCQIFGRFAKETFIPRFSILIPLLIFIIISKRTVSLRPFMISAYIMAHYAMWSTIWAIYYLPDRQYAREGFIIMHFAFFAISLAMPVIYAAPLHGCVILNIIISNIFIHYESFDMMITLALPVYFGIIFIDKIMENSYVDHFKAVNKLEHFSVTDQLTGAYNRNKLSEITLPGTNKLSLCDGNIYILMADIDFFKRVNDNYGHTAGDKVLASFTSWIRSSLRSKDILIRWGGEEFVILLCGVGYAEASVVAERILNVVRKSDNGICHITCSIGVAPYDGNDLEIGVKNADNALYLAKKSGRDRAVFYK